MDLELEALLLTSLAGMLTSGFHLPAPPGRGFIMRLRGGHFLFSALSVCKLMELRESTAVLCALGAQVPGCCLGLLASQGGLEGISL